MQWILTILSLCLSTYSLVWGIRMLIIQRPQLRERAEREARSEGR